MNYNKIMSKKDVNAYMGVDTMLNNSTNKNPKVIDKVESNAAKRDEFEKAQVEVPKKPKVEPEVVVEEEQVVQDTPEVSEDIPEETVEESPVEVGEVEETSTDIDILGLTNRVENPLRAASINTMEELLAYLDSGSNLESITGIGASASKTILAKVDEWQKTMPTQE